MHDKRTPSTLVAVRAALLALSAVVPAAPAWSQTPPPAVPPAQGAVPGAVPGANPAEPAAEPPTDAERFIDVAIKQLAGIKSVSADMLQTVDMLKQKFEIKGQYRKAPDSRVYLKLTVSGLPDSGGTMLQVCDGETLWDYQQILENQIYRKISIKPILELLNNPEVDAELRDQIMTQMGFSGPEALLVGARKAIKFEQKEEDELDGKPVWKLRGTWRSRNGLVGPDQRPFSAMGPLPPYVPSDATLYIGKEDGWPYKLTLQGRVSPLVYDFRQRTPDGRLLGSKSSVEKVDASRMELTYSNVVINPTLAPQEFAFQAPPNAAVEDSTDLIVKGLNQAIQVSAMQKRAQANQQDGPIIDEPIRIPDATKTEPTP